jgi:hypothetical protein
MNPTSLFCGTFLAMYALAAQAAPNAKPTSTPQDLFDAVLAQDTALFDAYNRCDLVRFKSLVASDVEFFHDHGGVTVGADALTKSIANNICGKVTRKLVIDSLEVYPMDNYGALEIGTHVFHHTNEPGAKDGQGKFVHLWQYDKKTATWKVTRVFSFDHHDVDK